MIKKMSIVLVNLQVAAIFLHKYITFQPRCSLAADSCRLSLW